MIYFYVKMNNVVVGSGNMFLDNTGKIIIVKNIVFKDFFKGKFVLTPDPHLSRPCLIISEFDDKRYVLPITSCISNEKYLYKKFKLYNNDMLYSTLQKKINYVKLDRIIPIEPYYKEPVGELSSLQYYECLLKLKEFYENVNFKCNEYEVIKNDVNKQLKKFK